TKVWRFDAARHFGLSLLVLVSLLAGVDCRSQRSGLTCRCIAYVLAHFGNSVRRLRIQLGGTAARCFIVFTGTVTQLLRCLTRAIDALSGRIGDVAAQFLSRFRGKKQCEDRTNAAADEQVR